jgi:CHRD domain
MKRKKVVLTSSLLGLVLVAVLVASAAFAHGDNGKSGKARLNGYQETPMSLSTSGSGSFRIKVRSDGLHYTLRYEDLEADANVAHIHLGARATSGGVIAFLCGGQDKPTCPLREGTVTGVIDAADVTGPAGQGIAAGELTEVIRALRAGAVYANVHTTKYPGGEIRGQVGSKGHNGKNGHDRKNGDRKSKGK